jgi:cytochrome c oxidase assembly protein subunit 15
VGYLEKLNRANRLSRSAIALIILLFVQVGLGMTNVLLLAPVWIQIAHLFVADALWILLVLASADLVLEAAKEGRKR